MAGTTTSQFWETYLPKLRELAGRGMTDNQIFRSGEIPVDNPSKIRNARARYGIPAGDSVKAKNAMRVISEHDERRVLAPTATEDTAAADVWEQAEKQTGHDVQKALVQNVAVVQIMTDKPVAFSISSDWHLRPRGALWLQALREYGESIRDTTGAYAVAVGDLLDNPIKWEKNMEEVPDGLLLLGHIFGVFGYKLLGTTDGNHDAWSRAFAGIDALKWLAEKDRIHYAPDELVYQVELIDPATHDRTARYIIATRHKYYRHSNLNPTHACFRWLEDRVGQWPIGDDGGEMIPDVLAIGHNHVACCEQRSFMNKDIWGARMGAWQLTTTHGRAGGWRQSPPTAPTFILYPHRAKPIWGHARYGEALAYLAHERQEWAA